MNEPSFSAVDPGLSRRRLLRHALAGSVAPGLWFATSSARAQGWQG